jgi:hypothetical protein
VEDDWSQIQHSSRRCQRSSLSSGYVSIAQIRTSGSCLVECRHDSQITNTVHGFTLYSLRPTALRNLYLHPDPANRCRQRRLVTTTDARNFWTYLRRLPHLGHLTVYIPRRVFGVPKPGYGRTLTLATLRIPPLRIKIKVFHYIDKEATKSL